jgi:hypothetical protein
VLAHQSTFFRAEAFRKAGGFNINNRIAWDGELWVDLALTGARFGRTSNFLSAFRIHGDSITGSGKFWPQYDRYCDDMFVRVKGRRKDWRDQVLQLLYKGFEYISHPEVIKQRVLAGPIVKRRLT